MCLLVLVYPIQESEVDFPMQQFGVSPERFQENADLCSFFKILTTSADEDDKVQYQTNFFLSFIQEWKSKYLKYHMFFLLESFFFLSIHIRYMSPQYKPGATL